MSFYLKKIFLFLLVSLFFGCNNENNNDISSEVQQIEVGYITLKSEEVPLQQELSGRIKAIYKSEVRPQIDGIIKEQLFKEGSFVKKGDVLYVIDPDSYQAIYEEALALEEEFYYNWQYDEVRQKHIKKVHTKRVNETKQKLDKILTGMFTFEYKLKNGSWNISKIARDSGLSRNTVYTYIDNI